MPSRYLGGSGMKTQHGIFQKEISGEIFLEGGDGLGAGFFAVEGGEDELTARGDVGK